MKSCIYVKLMTIANQNQANHSKTASVSGKREELKNVTSNSNIIIETIVYVWKFWKPVIGELLHDWSNVQ